MNSFKNGFYFFGAVLLLICIGMLIWYVLFYVQRMEPSSEGTLVHRSTGTMICQTERLISDDRKMVVL